MQVEAWQCDSCGTIEVSDTEHNLPPKGWIQVYYHIIKEREVTVACCTLACVADYFAEATAAPKELKCLTCGWEPAPTVIQKSTSLATHIRRAHP